MTVYVDNMRAPYGRMVMCHMIADTEEELHIMAAAIGVARKWYQKGHYDICLSKRAKAIEYGAIEVTRRELGIIILYKRHHHFAPHNVKAAVEWWNCRLQSARAMEL